MLQVEVVSPEAIIYSGDAEMVVARTVGGGDIAFQPGHVPFIGVLQIWSAKIIKADGADEFAVHSGFLQMAHDKVTILSDVSETKDEIDIERATEAKTRAEAAIAGSEDDSEAKAALQRAQVRLSVAGVSSASY
ncbi:MAG: ATP synthase F1 subunit epsilon [Acidimicrobiales bacterium]